MIASVATSEFCIHLRTLSTGDPHPFAKVKVLQCLYEDEDDGSYCIQIFGELVAVLFTPASFEESMLVVWNWQTGKLLLVTMPYVKIHIVLTYLTRKLCGGIFTAFRSYPMIVF